MESNTAITYNRKYKKVTNMLSTIGGIAKSLLFIGFIIIYPIN
jgi:hypothetical protein